MHVLYRGHAPVVLWLQVMRDGIPQLVSTVPLTDWYGTADSSVGVGAISYQVRVLFSPIEVHFVLVVIRSLFC